MGECFDFKASQNVGKGCSIQYTTSCLLSIIHFLNIIPPNICDSCWYIRSGSVGGRKVVQFSNFSNIIMFFNLPVLSTSLVSLKRSFQIFEPMHEELV